MKFFVAILSKLAVAAFLLLAISFLLNILRMYIGNKPDRDEVLKQIEHYKNVAGIYPESLEKIGVDPLYPSGSSYSYTIGNNGLSFKLCCFDPPYVGTVPMCFNSQSEKWVNIDESQ